MRRLMSVLLWSAIAGAFIGPGTVTTAAAAGAGFQLRLLWALVFSTVACLALQEAAARLTVTSGRDLGQALRDRFEGGASGVAVVVLVLGAVVLGCAAYQAGNLLGTVVGADQLGGIPRPVVTLVAAAMAGVLLWAGAPHTVARSLSLLVAVMGVAFAVTAAAVGPDVGALLRGALLPVVPQGGGALVLALVGTTVVPYNLFMGSALARGQQLGELRFGLAVAVVLGGAISAAVLVVGSAMGGEFSYAGLAEVLALRLGPVAPLLLGCGLLAAGLSSAITAPLAAAMTAGSLFGEARWHRRSWRFRAVWLGVLAAGVAGALTDVRPVPAIVAAQAFNGVLLPVVAVFLLVAANDRSVVGERGLARPAHAVLMGLVVLVTVVLGVSAVIRAGARAAGTAVPDEGTVLVLAALVAAVLAWPVGRAVVRGRRRPPARPGRET